MMLTVAIVGVVSFAISGGILVLFWRSLQKNPDETRSSTRGVSIVLLVALIVVLAAIGIYFMHLGLQP